MIYMMMEKA